MLRVGIKLRLDFNQLPLKKQKRSFHVLLINKNTSYCHVRRRESVLEFWKNVVKNINRKGMFDDVGEVVQ